MDGIVRWVLGPLGYIAAMGMWFGFANCGAPAGAAIMLWIILTSYLE